MSVVLGIDLGGTTVEGLAIDGDDIAARAQIATRTGSGDSIVSSVVEVAGNLIDELSAAPVALGVGLPGIVDAQAGTVQNALNLGIDDEFPFVDRLHEELDGLPIAIENDVRLGALGAHQHFAAASDSLVYVGIGTGIAAGIMIDGTLYRGATGMAGEVGHARFANDPSPCHCGRIGCLEAVASGPAIARAWGSTAQDLFDSALSGDAQAQAAAEPIIDQLACAIENIVRLFDPAFVVLGGGVGTSTPSLRTLLIEKFAQVTHNVLLDESDLDARLRQLPAGWPAGAQGAAEIARNINTQEGNQ